MSTEPPKFTIETITVDDTDEDEPLCRSLGLLDCKEVREYILDDLSDNCSFKAVNEQGEIIGLVISAIKKRLGSNEHEVEQIIENEKWKKVIDLVEHCYRQWNIYELYPYANVILDGRALAVHPKYRRLGIAGQLIEKYREYMPEHNIPVMRRFCSSIYSAKVMDTLGMKEVHKLVYDDFKVNGEVFIKPAAPHLECKSFVMEI